MELKIKILIIKVMSKIINKNRKNFKIITYVKVIAKIIFNYVNHIDKILMEVFKKATSTRLLIIKMKRILKRIKNKINIIKIKES